MKRTLFSLVLLTLVTSALRTPSALARDVVAYEPPEFIREPAVLPVAATDAAARPMTLQQAIVLAVANNLGVTLSRERLRSAELGLKAAHGRFEPSVVGLVTHTKSDFLPASNLQGGPGDVLRSITDAWALSINQPIPTGANVSVALRDGRSNSTSADALRPIQYASNLELNLSQPILRGFSFDLAIPRMDILRARLSNDRAGLSLRLSIMTTVRDAENAYWDLVQALKNYQVRKQSLESSLVQRDLSKRQIRAGVLAPSDLINAESTVASRRLDMVQALANVQRNSDRLRMVLNLPRDQWMQPILPRDAPTYEQATFHEKVVLDEALRLRPEISQQKISLREAALDVRVAKNNELPQIDLGFRYSVSGQKTKYTRTVRQALSADAPSWTALMTLTWTPLNRAAGARTEASRVGRRIAQSQMDQRVLDLYGEVRAVLRSVETAGRQVVAAAKFREFAQRNLDVEQRKFLNGTSNNFMIQQRQEALALARLAELGAVILRQKAIAQLHLVKGTILDHRNIKIDDRKP